MSVKLCEGDLTDVRGPLADAALVLPRAPGGAIRIGKPKDSSSDPVPEPDTPGGAPARIGAGDEGGQSSGGSTGPARIGADTPAQGANGGPTLIGESKDYNTLKDKGAMVDALLQTSIRNKEDDVQLPILKDKYKVDESTGLRLDVGTMDKDLEQPMKDAGIQTDQARYSTSTVHSKDDTNSRGLIAEGKFYDQDGVIIGESRFAGNDRNAAGDKMKPSDILWSQYSGFASHMGRSNKLQRGMTNDVGKLKAFVGRNIQSRSALETIDTAHKKTNQDPTKPGIFKRSADTQEEKDAFSALLGTDSLSSVNYMLKDHHTAAGNKQITEIRTYPRAWDKTKTDGRLKAAILAKMDVVI